MLRTLVIRLSMNFALLLCLLGNTALSKNGFDLSRHAVPIEEIRAGGPPRDGIPAITAPAFIPASEATFLGDDDRILGIAGRHESKAYPVKILNWHEIVNDWIDDRPILITYCPLCGTGIAFDRRIQGQPAIFGVSGLLYQSDLLMYDRTTESLWSQIAMKAVAGPLTGTSLQPVFLEHTTWGAWRRAHPRTTVLSTETGFVRDYARDPYSGYAQRPELMFPTPHHDDRYPPKEWVLGVEIDGIAKAYPFSELRRTSGHFADRIGGHSLHIDFDASQQSATIRNEHGAPIPSVLAYWFAWVAFHPDTLVFAHE